MANKLPRNHTEECIACKKRFKKLSEEGTCYSCYCNRHGKPSKEFNPIGKYNG